MYIPTNIQQMKRQNEQSAAAAATGQQKRVSIRGEIRTLPSDAPPPPQSTAIGPIGAVQKNTPDADMLGLYDIINRGKTYLIANYLHTHPQLDKTNPWPINYAVTVGDTIMIELLNNYGFVVSQQCIACGIVEGHLDLARYMIRSLPYHWNKYHYETTVDCLLYRNSIPNLEMFEGALSFTTNSYVLMAAILGQRIPIVKWIIERYGVRYPKHMISDYIYDALSTNNLEMIQTVASYLMEEPRLVVFDPNNMMIFCIRRDLNVGFHWIRYQYQFELTRNHFDLAISSHHKGRLVMANMIRKIILKAREDAEQAQQLQSDPQSGAGPAAAEATTNMLKMACKLDQSGQQAILEAIVEVSRIAPTEVRVAVELARELDPLAIMDNVV